MIRTVYLVTMIAVLTTPVKTQELSKEIEAVIVETALNYGDGFYSGSGERMARAIAPDLMKLAPMKLPNDNKTILIQLTWSGLIEMSAAKIGFTEEAARKISATALLVDNKVALARLNSSQFNDYLQMVNFDGEWKIVNVLWTFGPDSRNRTQVPDLNPEEEKPRIEATVRDFVEGLLAGEGPRVTRALHPRFTQATIQTLPQTGKMMIQREGADMLIGLARVGLAKQDLSKINLDIKLIDYMDGLAMVELLTPQVNSYFQLAWLDGEWKLVNCLRQMTGNR